MRSVVLSLSLAVSAGAQAIKSVVVSLPKPSLLVGEKAGATTVITDATGAHPTRVVTYGSSNITVATVSASGTVTGVGLGTTLITGTVNHVNGYVSVTVVTPTSTPSPVPATNTTASRLINALSGPLIPASQVPSAFSFYETNFKHYVDSQWVVFGAKWDAGNSISAYERGAINYIYWVRTGDTTYKSRAHQTVVNYRDNYVLPAFASGSSPSPHWSQAESLYLDCVVMKDSASCNAVNQIAQAFSGFTYGYLTNTAGPDIEHRIQARVITALWMAEKLQGAPMARLDTAINQTLSTLNADGYGDFASTCHTSLNYMGGMLYDVLTRIHDQRPGAYNAVIEAKALAFGKYLWATQWRGVTDPTDLSFNYLSGLCMGTGSPTSAPDLNGLIVPLFGWLGKTTGDTTWFGKGDQILSGMKNASVYLYRQFSESYSSSPRYFGYRYPSLRMP